MEINPLLAIGELVTRKRDMPMQQPDDVQQFLQC